MVQGETDDAKIQAQDFSSETLLATSKLLTWNPEYYSIWNARRKTVRHLLDLAKDERQDSKNDRGKDETHRAVSDLISNDLHFLLPLLRKFPKCYWIWNYRLWLLNDCTRRLPATQARQFWEQELGLIGKMLSLDSRNFHGWGYRRTVIRELESLSPQQTEHPKSLTEQEFEYTTKMINTNLSNFSAWHNRSKLIPLLLDERRANKQARRKMLDEGEYCSMSFNKVLIKKERTRVNPTRTVGWR